MKEFIVETVRCHRSRGAKDACRLEFWVDGMHVKSRRTTMKKGSTWSTNEKLLAKSLVQLIIVDENTETLLAMTQIPVEQNTTKTKTLTFKSSAIYYTIQYSLQPSSAPEPVTVLEQVSVGGQTRYVKEYATQGSYDLFYGKSDASPWTGKWSQSDEPHSNYCGPTAGKNLLYWYGKSASYSNLAALMKTGHWDDEIPLYLFLDPVLAGIWIGLSQEVIKGGTLTFDMKATLESKKPSGVKLYYKETHGVLTDLTDQLKKGRPVMVLYSPKEWGFHWALVTGIYKNSTGIYVRFANGNKMTWQDFKVGWRLNIPVDAGRAILNALGLKSYSMLYYR